MKNLRKKFAIIALATSTLVPLDLDAQQKDKDPVPDYTDVTVLFYKILLTSAQVAATNPDMAKAGLEAVQSMIAELDSSYNIKINLAPQKPGETLTMENVASLFHQLSKVSDAGAIAEEDLSRLGIQAIEDMLKDIDPHADYFPPEEWQRFNSQMNSKTVGIGIRFDKKAGQPIEILSVLNDQTPAHRAGIRKGDLITHIDGVPVADLPTKDAIGKIQGQAGTSVILTIQRGNTASFDVSVNRETIKISPVSSRLIDNVGYVRLDRFTSTASEDVADAITKLKKSANGALTGFILDLRQNGGGYLGEAVEISDHFLEKGDVVSVDSRSGTKVYKAGPGDLIDGKPLVVLVDEYTASASEIVAGALQDHGRALILGVQSYGKGTVQTPYNLGQGHAFKITTAFYYTPDRRSIQGRGITPDIRVELPGAAKDSSAVKREADRKGSYANPSGSKDLTRTFATCAPDPNVDPSKVDKNLRLANGTPDYLLMCAIENLGKNPVHTKTTPVPQPPSQ